MSKNSTIGVAFLGLGRMGETHLKNLSSISNVKVVVVADSSKLGRTGFARICDVEAVDELITDDAATDEQVAELTAVGVTVTRV